MTWEAVLTILSALGLLVGLARRIAPPDVLALFCLATIVIPHYVFDTDRLPDAKEAFAGFGNEGLITIALLFVVVAGLEMTGGTEIVASRLLRRRRGILATQAKLCIPVAGLSGFLNNTPVVAALMPVVTDLTKRTGYSPSRFLLPLSYAAVLGGLCTLIGTSTNLIVAGMLNEFSELRGVEVQPIGFFTLGKVGLPAAILGVTYVLLANRWLLKDRRPAVSITDDPRQYTVEMTVRPGGPLVGQSIEDAGLRALPGLYLVEIQRGDEVLAAVEPTTRLRDGDLLIFVGVLDSVVDLRKFRGLEAALDQTRKLDVPAWHRTLVEAVVSPRCPLLGKTIRTGGFRTRYGAAVIAVARGGERVPGKIGDVRLEAGDVLLLEASPDFARRRRDSRDFFLVSAVDNSTPRRHERVWVALGIMIAMVVVAAWHVDGGPLIPITIASLVAAMAMIGFGCCTTGEARRSVDWSLLVVIGATLGIGRAIETSGAAATLAGGLMQLAGGNLLLLLAVVYLSTLLCTEIITNNAAAALMFPLAWTAALGAGADPLPFAVAVAIASSSAFATPFGYQTNLMVYGPGGYHASDYLRFGLPLNFLVFAVAMLLIPWFFPLQQV